MQKKLMILGGSNSLIPTIEAAHKLGLHVITVDYLPNNIAHRYSDEYHNVSVIDQQAVLALAQRLKVDGISSFACDAGVISASFAANAMGLPCHPHESVLILQNKQRFRQFLRDNGFNAPWSKSFHNCEEAIAAIDKEIIFPCIVKPTDSNGSRGVACINSPAEAVSAIRAAFGYSRSGEIIIEAYIDCLYPPSDSDCFSVAGEMKFVSFSAQYFDKAEGIRFTPAGFSWPSPMPAEHQHYLAAELQRLVSLLHLNTSIYNVESRVGTDGKPYIMECSPRGGGNRIAEMIRYSTGVDLIENDVRAAVGMPLLEFPESYDYQGSWGSVILHANREGRLKEVKITNDDYKRCLVDTHLLYQPGDTVQPFTSGDKALGSMLFHFADQATLRQAITTANQWVQVDMY